MKTKYIALLLSISMVFTSLGSGSVFADEIGKKNILEEVVTEEAADEMAAETLEEVADEIPSVTVEEAVDEMIAEEDASAAQDEDSDNTASEDELTDIDEEASLDDTEDILTGKGLDDFTNMHRLGGIKVKVNFTDPDINNYADGEKNLHAEQEHASSYIPTAEDLPQMRNQGEWGNCWAHSAVAAVEMSAIKHGIADNTIDLSELQVSRFTNSDERSFDEFDNIINDINDKDSDYDFNDYIEGGNTAFTSQALMAHMGLVNEADDARYSWSAAHAARKDKFGKEDEAFLAAARKATPDGETTNWPVFYNTLFGSIDHIPLDKKNAYGNDKYTVTGYKYVPIGVEWIPDEGEEGGYSFEQYPLDPVKDLIEDYGGLSIFYNSIDQCYSDSDGDKKKDCFYWNGYKDENTDGGGHLVTLVGWDDDYDKDNFANSEYGREHGSVPENDGAWLMRNSWDANYTQNVDPSAGDYAYDVNQYFWMSYEDRSLCDAYAFDVEKTSPSEHLYQYDGSQNTTYIGGINETVGANVFEVSAETGFQKLNAVEVDLGSTNTDINIKIVKNPKDDNPSEGESVEAATTSVFRDYVGYGKYVLNNPVYLEPGDKYAIIITASKEGARTSIGVETTYAKRGFWKPAIAYSEPGQSFFYEASKGGWVDTANGDYYDMNGDYKVVAKNLRIKGITSDVSEDEYYSAIGTSKEKKVSETEYEINLATKEKYSLDVLKKSAEDGKNYKISYGSTEGKSDNRFAALSPDGIISAKKAGTAHITLNKNGVEYKITVNVVNPQFGKFTDAKKKVYVANVGQKLALSYAKNGFKTKFVIDNKSKNKGIAEINESTGVITANKRGTVTVTAIVGGEQNDKYARKVSAKVVIVDPTFVDIKIGKKGNINELPIGKQVALKVKYGYGKAVYTVDNEAVATIDKKNRIKAVGFGKTTLKIVSNGRTIKKEITVPNPEIISSKDSVSVGKSISLKIKNGVKETSWSVSDESIATISAKGVLKGKSAGKVLVTAVNNGYKMTKEIVVQ